MPAPFAKAAVRQACDHAVRDINMPHDEAADCGGLLETNGSGFQPTAFHALKSVELMRHAVGFDPEQTHVRLAPRTQQQRLWFGHGHSIELAPRRRR